MRPQFGKRAFGDKREERDQTRIRELSRWSPPATWFSGSLVAPGNWHAVEALYRTDDVEAAFELAQQQGVGSWAQFSRFIRLMEAEALTRRESILYSINDWLELEFVPTSDSPDPATLASDVRTVCESVGQMLGWGFKRPALVTVIAEQADAPWVPGRDGVFLEKTDYDKVCIPHWVVRDQGGLAMILAHEYAHVVSFNMSEGRIPPWLGEAISTALESEPRSLAGSSRGKQKARSKSGVIEGWKSPQDLSRILSRWLYESYPIEEVSRAYAQAQCVGDYLMSLRGFQGLGDVLKQLARITLWGELLAWLGVSKREEFAVREVYGRTSGQLFDATRAQLIRLGKSFGGNL